MTKKNILTAGKKRKADQVAQAGDQLQAQTLYASVCKLDPTDVEAWTKLSFIEKALGNYQQAENCARRALALNPKLAYGHYALAQALHSRFERLAAIASYRVAIALMPEFSDAHFLLGLALHEQGDMAGARASLQLVLLYRPDFPEARAELGAVYLELGLVEAGLEQLQHAVQLQPTNLAALGNISHALRLLGKNQEALDNFRRALVLVPDDVELIAGLAGLLEKVGQVQEAQSLIDQGLQLNPVHAMSHLVAARLERSAQFLQAAIDRLQRVLQPSLPADLSAEIMLELGQIYDQMGDAAHAWPLIVEGKRRKAMATLDEANSSNDYLVRLARIRQLATTALADVLRVKVGEFTARDSVHTAVASPVFLIGFPRSGTTLMEQILDSHPRIQAMEEKSTVARMVNRALEMMDAQQCVLEDLGETQVAELRALYFVEAGKYVGLIPGNILVDKMPLNTVGVPVIARVFPDAKFILAIRHPCDVSLSCLMQNFATNAGMANFFTIGDTAHLYAQVMGAWLQYVRLLPLNFHQIRYEDLVADVALESRKLLEFLGLPWDDAVLEHTAHARQRGAINTPSYHQVVQPIYQRSKYRWKRYEQELTDVMPVLQPFIEEFGYT